jgi:hypothetical protein
VMPVQFLTVHQRRSTGRAGSVLAYRQGPLVGRQHFDLSALVRDESRFTSLVVCGGMV